MVAKLVFQRSAVAVAAVALFASVPAVGLKKRTVDPRLREVRTVFIKGNNEAAVKARDDLSKWTCFRLAKNAGAADAMLEFSQQQSVNGALLSSNRERSIVSAELTTKDGDVLWSKSATQDAGFINTGAGSAARSVLFHLQRDAFPEVKLGFRGVDKGGCPEVSEPENSAVPGATSQAEQAPQPPASAPKELKLGMTAADVEKILGPPLTKVDLGEKVLYKYKDMTVEFHDGKVTDVR
jgi:hypothetical protein